MHWVLACGARKAFHWEVKEKAVVKLVFFFFLMKIFPQKIPQASETSKVLGCVKNERCCGLAVMVLIARSTGIQMVQIGAD